MSEVESAVAPMEPTSEAQGAPHSEFEREPVPERAHLGFKSFIGMYAGEHCAGTELMIGPLFVAAGVSAADLIGGLLLGNLLAVLSWTFLTAPIATRSRLTLYYQLEKICGGHLVKLYNVANGVAFCFLAGAMVTVSATAVGEWFNVPMPGLNDRFPNSVAWVVAVFAVGLAISYVAAAGYTTVARFANIAAPWMVLVFLAFGVIGLAKFINASGAEVNSVGDAWELAETAIWTGGEPFAGQEKFTFWHVMFFAWFCNMAMHIGMSDLSVFRFAKKSWYGVSTASGMYVGHFMAWIAAATLFAFQLYDSRPDEYMANLLVQHGDGTHTMASIGETPLTPALVNQAYDIEARLDEAGDLTAFKQRLIDEGAFADRPNAARITPEDVAVVTPAPLPGQLANNAAGVAGLLCVIIAGWTTANPTIYRAGLAFQAIVPKASRFWVTFGTGMVVTTVGLFPFIAMSLLDFVAIYGLILMPMGAVIFTDFWLFPKLGLKQNFAEHSGIRFNWAAGAAWLVTMAICVGLINFLGHVQVGGVYVFSKWFLALPGWFIAAAIYIALSRVIQSSQAAPAGAPAEVDTP